MKRLFVKVISFRDKFIPNEAPIRKSNLILDKFIPSEVPIRKNNLILDKFIPNALPDFLITAFSRLLPDC